MPDFQNDHLPAQSNPLIMRKIILSLVLSCIFLTQLQAQLRLGAPFSDHMVLQRNSIATIWGWSEGGNSTIEVKVSWSDEVFSARSNHFSKWQVEIPTPDAGGPYQININNSIILKDVLIGEVWLASGQSNMQWSANAGIDNAEEAIKNANNDQIRFLYVPRTGAESPQIDIDCKWEVCTSKTMASFSAVAYFFGKTLQEDLDIPIGLIHSSWGGTSAEVWTPKEIINSDPEFSNWETVFNSNGYQPREPGVLFNAMITPLIPFDIAGVIWYQGETNSANPFVYRRLFPAMISSWREAFDKEFPFYYVQLAPFNYGHPMVGALVQEAQLKTMSAIENVGMAVINDIGNVNDIHPQNKKDVGKRLAAWALNKNYGKQTTCSGPIYQSMEKQGQSLVIHFKYADGLHFKGGTPKELLIAGPDGHFLPAKAKTDNDKLIVSHEDIKDPAYVRYAFSNTSVGNLYNAAGLPASPFRTDDRSIVLTTVDIDIKQENRQPVIHLSTNENAEAIIYTLDGSVPGADAAKYSTPLTKSESFHLKARAIVNGRFSEAIAEKNFLFSKSTYAPVKLESNYSEYYAASGQNALTDGLLGSLAYNDGNWQGYIESDIIATIDLGKIQKVKRIKTQFLRDQRVWIFLPSEVIIAYSIDGKNYELVDTHKNQLIPMEGISIQEIDLAGLNKKARFIRITAKNAGPCPDWHPGAGGKSWVFMDEVLID
ncbi:MAG: hypothetical protein DWQ02_15680 [Bacteroidetes bacterium]|nr:MAG: hypothetical protein DWQ02_15680 [Bacteroidota bacterium]